MVWPGRFRGNEFCTPCLLVCVLHRRHGKHDRDTPRMRAAIFAGELRTCQKSLLKKCAGEGIGQRLEHDHACHQCFSVLRGRCTPHLRDRKCHQPAQHCFRSDPGTVHHVLEGIYCNRDTLDMIVHQINGATIKCVRTRKPSTAASGSLASISRRSAHAIGMRNSRSKGESVGCFPVNDGKFNAPAGKSCAMDAERTGSDSRTRAIRMNNS